MVIIAFVFFRVWADRGAFSGDVWHSLGLNASNETVLNETNIYFKALLEEQPYWIILIWLYVYDGNISRVDYCYIFILCMWTCTNIAT